MKKLLVCGYCFLLLLVCSCQKQDSTAEQHLAQRRSWTAAQGKALDEREKALAEREKLIAKPRVPSVSRITT
jgi:hypothetical protein